MISGSSSLPSSSRSHRPLFIAIEGADGTGKTTVSAPVVERLRALGLSVSLKPEFPEGKLSAEFGEALTKGLFLADHLSMPAAASFFYLTYAQVLAIASTPPADIVIADRYLHSLSIYQPYFIHTAPQPPDPVTVLTSLEHLFTVLSLPLPDRVLVLDARLDTLERRLAIRERRNISAREKEILEIFCQAYRTMASLRPDVVTLLDSDRPAEDVAEDVVRYILEAHRA